MAESLFRFVKEGVGLVKHLRWAIDAKVALEIALGAAMGGHRNMVTMKEAMHFTNSPRGPA